MKYRLFNCLSVLLLIALSVVVLAQQPSATTPSVDRIRQVIEYLASGALEGRRTGTPGAKDAAHYIAREFDRYGSRPGMQSHPPCVDAWDESAETRAVILVDCIYTQIRAISTRTHAC